MAGFHTLRHQTYIVYYETHVHLSSCVLLALTSLSSSHFEFYVKQSVIKYFSSNGNIDVKDNVVNAIFGA